MRNTPIESDETQSPPSPLESHQGFGIAIPSGHRAGSGVDAQDLVLLDARCPD
jgi:hypothetical protein